METLYRKVAVSERLPKEEGDYFFKERGGFDFKLETYRVSKEKFFRNNFNYWLEEIPDPTTQLKSDKEEILVALDALNENYKANNEDACEHLMSFLPSLIQKHKQ